MSEEPNPVGDQQRRKRLSPVTMAIMLLVLYPLSIGPAAALVSWLGPRSVAGPKANQILMVIYGPLVWIAEKSPALLEALKGYLVLFKW